MWRQYITAEAYRVLLAREWRTVDEAQTQNDVLYISIGKHIDRDRDLLITMDRGRYVCTAGIYLLIDVGVTISVVVFLW